MTKDPSPNALPPLVEWKLARPHSRPGVVLRPRLFAALDREATLVLVAAPAGFGKTELVASWLENRRDLSPAWVSVDAGDADPVRFWMHVASSVDRVRPGMGRPALARLRTPGTPVEESIDELMNGIATFAGRLVIVIDDLHHFASIAPHGSFTRAVDHLPEPARVVATSRADPVLRLARLRARGAIADLRADQLGFTVAEARELLVDRMGVELADEDVELLVEHTEGWPAGLCLAGLWLAEVEDPARRVRSFTGDHRQVTDYLTDEVLETFDDENRRFMVHTSVLDRLCGPLCDAVLQTTGSDRRLEALARTNLFLVPLDRRGEWYRYHQLFRDVLALELLREDASRVPELHRRAATWFAEIGLLEEALHHGAQSGDPAEVASLLSQHYLPLARSGHLEAVLFWVLWLPPEQLRLHPDVAGTGALVSAILGRPTDERMRLIEIAESSLAGTTGPLQLRAGTVTALARAGSIVGDLRGAVQAARQAVRLALEEGDALVVGALAALAYGLYLQGEIEEADEAVQRALARPEAPQRSHGYILAIACAALIQHDRGHVRFALELGRRSLQSARRLGLAGVWVTGLARLAIGQAALTTGSIAEAERHLERAEMLRRAAQPTLEHIHALLVLARARVARGRLPLAASELDTALEGLDSFSDAGRLPALAEQVREQLAHALARTSSVVEPPTAAELSVLRLLATDLSRREIAQELFLSFNTVKTHSRNLYRKLGATSRADAVRRASEFGLLD